MTAHDSLLALQRLRDLTVLTQQQYTESTDAIAKAVEILAARLSDTTKDMADLSATALDTHSVNEPIFTSQDTH